MTNTRRFVIICCAFFSISGSIRAAEVEPFTITNDPRWQSYPRISGNRVVYNSNSGGSAIAYDLDVDGYNIWSENHFNVDDDYSRDWAPCVSGPNVVWAKAVGSDTHIYARNVVTGVLTPVCTASGARGLPQISGSNVVWYDARGGKKAIYGYDLSSPGEFVVVPDNARSYAKMGLDGDMLVYEDYRSGSRIDLYARNIKTGAEVLASDGVNHCVEPDISGSTVVYRSTRSSISNVYAFNIVAGVETPITTSVTWSGLPKIDGNIAVWSDARNGNNNIWGKNLATGYEFQISTATAMERWSDISGNTVVWANEAVLYRNNIWGATLNIPSMFVQGTFNAGSMASWTPSATGTVQTIVDPGDPSNYCLELLTGSPVSVTHTVSTPDLAFSIFFDYEFTSTSGTLTIELDGQLIDTIGAPAVLAGDFESYSVKVDDPSLLSLNDILLSFTLNDTGGVPAGIMLDEIDFQLVPEPATIIIMMAAGLPTLLKRKRKSR
ncbi:MAG: PEP-CTERM sorting domain-containing protein [Phycisphaerales bacterium]|jgi:beta propeller repeat protein|nr:PEP-CTERM sorting domain-containing protein [Phycisphaerales bacterium]